jgi:zinc transport system ATP-binding protein
MNAVMELQDISFSWSGEEKLHYATESLHHVTFSVREGSFTGMIGPNGAGKTTLLRIALGRLQPHPHGWVKIFGKSLDEFKEWWRIGYVPQTAIAFDKIFPATVEEVVGMGRCGRLGLLGRLGPADRRAIRSALTATNMIGVAKKRIGALSTGEQQRVMIARALASEPELLILDEPIVGVDIAARREFYAMLKRLNDRGLTILLASHDIDEIARLTDELIYINDRTVQYLGPTRRFFASRKMAAVAREFHHRR